MKSTGSPGAATGVLAIGHYVRLLFVPAPLCADYRGVIAPVTSMVDDVSPKNDGSRN